MTEPGRAEVNVGHFTDAERRTGCTVILFDRLCSAVVDVRGGAPGTRETDLLAADRLVGRVDAILLTGGSAFGLGAANGVVRFLRERGRGFPTPAGPVPIVPAAVIYDLSVGEASWPTEDDAHSACESALPIGETAFGQVGAGTGATYRKLWSGMLSPLRGGIGRATQDHGGRAITAISVVNAVGDVVFSDGEDHRASLLANAPPADERTATTLVVVIVTGECDDQALRRIAISAHDGMARAIVPCHTISDGDLVFVVQTGETTPMDPVQTLQLTTATELAVEASIRNAVRPAPAR
jgi:L-aminopeptidase/D-esterase-like protein